MATLKREASPFRFDELAAAAAADWGNFKDEGGWPLGALAGRVSPGAAAARQSACIRDLFAHHAVPPSTSVCGCPATLCALPSASPNHTHASGAPAGFKIVAALPVDTRLATYAPPSAASLAKDDGALAAAAPAAEGSAAPAASEPEQAEPLAKVASTAEAEAVSAAAEAGPLASAIAEALAGVGPAIKPAAKPGGKPEDGAAPADGPETEPSQDGPPQEAAAAAAQPPADGETVASEASKEVSSNPFEVSFDDGPAPEAADDSAAAAAAAAAAVAADVDAFAAFDDAPAAGSSPVAEAIPAVKPAAGAFGSSQALGGADSPTAKGDEGSNGVGKAAAGGAGPADSWTAF